MSCSKALFLPAILAFCGVPEVARAQWSPENPLTSTGGNVWGFGIAAAGRAVHVIYGTGDLRHRKSTDEGATWSASALVGAGTLHLTDPIVADGDDVWVVYLSNLQNVTDWLGPRDSGSIWLRRSRDGGATWDAPMQLSGPSTAFRLSIAYAADRLHLVWMDYRSGGWDTYYRRSRDRGATWDPETVIAQSTGPFGAERPQVAARGDSVHVTVWDDRGDNGSCRNYNYTFPKCPDVFHLRSVDGGSTWGPITNVANGGIRFAGRNDIAVAGGSSVIINFNVEVEGETGSKLFAVASGDDGATWGTPIRLTTSANGSDHGSLIGSGGATYLVWHDDRNASNREIYYRRSPNGGASWDPEEQVSANVAGDSSTPLNAVSPNYAHVVWIDNRGGSYQVYYRRRALELAPTSDAGVQPDARAQDDASLQVPDAGPIARDASSGEGPDARVSDAAFTHADASSDAGAGSDARVRDGGSMDLDASAGPDARVSDAGSFDLDATSDAGATADASAPPDAAFTDRDAGSQAPEPSHDAGAAVDATAKADVGLADPSGALGGGCGCRAAGGSPATQLPWSLPLLAAWFGLRRRRRP